MKYLAGLLALAALPAGILADGASVKTAIVNCDNAAINYNKSIIAFTKNDAGQAQAAVNAVPKLLNTLDNNAQAVKASGALSTGEAMGLLNPVQTLVNDILSTLDNIASKQNLFQKQNLMSQVCQNVLSVQDAADNFADLVIAKVPNSLRSYARNQITKMDPAFDNLAGVYC